MGNQLWRRQATLFREKKTLETSRCKARLLTRRGTNAQEAPSTVFSLPVLSEPQLNLGTRLLQSENRPRCLSSFSSVGKPRAHAGTPTSLTEPATLAKTQLKPGTQYKWQTRRCGSNLTAQKDLDSLWCCYSKNCHNGEHSFQDQQ